jgi:predicted nucleic acid-binding protein
VIRVCAQLPGGKWAPATTADRLLLLTITGHGYDWWPDSYLLSLARRNGGRLVTFDRELATHGGVDVVLLPEAS